MATNILKFVSVLGIFLSVSVRQIESQANPQKINILRYLGKYAGLPKASEIGTNQNDSSVCYKDVCLDAAADILEGINLRENPCDPDGFGKFACHRRIHSTTPFYSKYGTQAQIATLIRRNLQRAFGIASSPVSSTDPKGLKAAKIMYRQCLGAGNSLKEATKGLVEKSNSFGGWPILTLKNLNEYNSDLIGLLAYNSRFLPTTKFFEISTVEGSSGFEIILDKGKLYMEDIEDEKEDFLNLYKLLVDKCDDMGLGDLQCMLLRNSQNTYLQNHLTTLTTLEDLLNYGASTRRTRMTIKEMTEYTFEIDWLRFFKSAYYYSHQNIKNDTVVWVNKPYLKSFGKVYNFAQNDNWLASILQLELFDTFKGLTSLGLQVDSNSNLQQACYNVIEKVFGAALSLEYLRLYGNPPGTAKDVEKMVYYVRKALVDQINLSPKFTDKVKAKLSKKFMNTASYLGYAKWLDNSTAVERYFDKLNVQDNNRMFFNNLESVKGWQLGTARDLMKKEIDSPHYWDLNGFIVDTNGANYYGVLNSLRIPSSFTSPPMYYQGAPAFVNFGALGTVIAHEFGHGMDVGSYLLNENGDRESSPYGLSYWDPQSNSEYQKWVADIKNSVNGSKLHYHGPNAEKYDLTLSPENTIKDDIADAIGLHVALAAYQSYVKNEMGGKDLKLPGLENIDPMKLFYVKYSNMWCEEMKEQQVAVNKVESGTHSPSYTRATVPLKRSLAFHKVFSCPRKPSQWSL